MGRGADGLQFAVINFPKSFPPSVFLEKLKDLNDGRKGGVVIRRCQFLIRLSYCPKLILFKCKTNAV